MSIFCCSLATVKVRRQFVRPHRKSSRSGARLEIFHPQNLSSTRLARDFVVALTNAKTFGRFLRD